LKHCVIFLFLALYGLESPFAQNYTDSLDIRLLDLYEKSELPGFSVAIIDSAGLVFAKGYGYANLKDGIPYSVHHTQLLASVSKTFIAVSLMQCIEDGLLTLNTPINDILPFKVNNPNFPEDTIRVVHLVNHSSGIIDEKNAWKHRFYLLEEPDFKSLDFMEEEKEFLSGIAGTVPVDLKSSLINFLTPTGIWYFESTFSKFRAGGRYEYSNIGSDLTAYIVEVVQKKKYSTYVIERIFKPLGMMSSGWQHNTPNPEYDVVTYLASGDPYPLFSDNTYPSGSAQSSVTDLAKFLTEMLNGSNGNGHLLTADSYLKMFQPVIKTDDSDSLGIFWHKQNYLKDMMKTGSGGDVTTVIGFNSSEGVGYALLCNHGTYPEKQSEYYVKVWQAIIKYRTLLNLPDW